MQQDENNCIKNYNCRVRRGAVEVIGFIKANASPDLFGLGLTSPVHKHKSG
jgi:hypothetical protein